MCKAENTLIQNRKLFIAIVVGHVLRLYLAEGIVCTLLCSCTISILIPWGCIRSYWLYSTMHVNPMGVVLGKARARGSY